MFKRIDNYFDLKHKIFAAIGSVVFTIVWMILWDMFPMQFYAIFCGSLIGSFIQLLILNAVVLPVFLLIFTLVSKTDLSFCKTVPINIFCIFGIEIMYGWGLPLLLPAIILHGAICLWAFGTAPVRDNKAQKGMKAPEPKREIAIKKQPLIAVIWAVAFAFSIDIVCLWLYRTIAIIYYPEMA